MNKDRRNFLKKACAAGGCFCGFSFLAGQRVEAGKSQEAEDTQKKLMQEWISILMVSMDEQMDETLARQIMKSCARAHYDQLKMDEVLQPFEGNPEAFARFLEESWNWKVDFDRENGIIHADENKDFCVCPMVSHQQGMNMGVLCYCSEGFAELMFSKVVGHPVQATVISSIHRGNDRCKYQIKL
ncbi:DUF6144 family protein [Mangrovibacterium diazotrophicum]|uniref:Secreted protein n=1 Tax=Mangrovibacterium diazotrophicum TaxID=1261403 RepID=A0A419W827_9BACT|nr:DUF6144 family protein [Mangrovibacterium diazotrophicum]RKD91641.1 secreted protein [Mangrovibacterium diazotrophicum]